MHEIQKQILKKLSLTKKAKYSELKSKDMEGNLFTYHLKGLLKEEYVVKKNDSYSLSAKGKRYTDRLSSCTLNVRIQPKIATLIVLKEKGKYLLYERKKMPFIHQVGFPYGKIHLEERIMEAAERELNEKTGLQATLKHRGDVYITVHDEMELISHMLCHVFSGTKITGEIKSDECFFGKLEDFPRSKLIPGVVQIAKLLEKNKTQFFFDEFFLNCSDEA